MTIACLLGAAPVQCGEPEPIRYARQQHPAEAVWELAERLSARGHGPAAAEAYRTVVERWPSSRWAERSRLRLAGSDAGTVAHDDGAGGSGP